MGTSRNDRSPSTPPWRMAWAVLGSPEIPAARQCLELWRAAGADRGQKLSADFGKESIAFACELLSKNTPLRDALVSFDSATMRESEPSLSLEMARRALARCAANRQGPLEFVGELFAEATSYYASRDLPSFVGAKDRVATTSESIQLKESLRQTTKQKVVALGEPDLAPRQWTAYIGRILEVLQRKE